MFESEKSDIRDLFMFSKFDPHMREIFGQVWELVLLSLEI